MILDDTLLYPVAACVITNNSIIPSDTFELTSPVMVLVANLCFKKKPN